MHQTDFYKFPNAHLSVQRMGCFGCGLEFPGNQHLKSLIKYADSSKLNYFGHDEHSTNLVSETTSIEIRRETERCNRSCINDMNFAKRSCHGWQRKYYAGNFKGSSNADIGEMRNATIINTGFRNVRKSIAKSIWSFVPSTMAALNTSKALRKTRKPQIAEELFIVHGMCS